MNEVWWEVIFINRTWTRIPDFEITKYFKQNKDRIIKIIKTDCKGNPIE